LKNKKKARKEEKAGAFEAKELRCIKISVRKKAFRGTV